MTVKTKDEREFVDIVRKLILADNKALRVGCRSDLCKPKHEEII